MSNERCHLSRLQSDAVSPRRLKAREALQVWTQDIHLAEHAGLFVGDPGGVHFRRVLGRKQVPALSENVNTITKLT